MIPVINVVCGMFYQKKRNYCKINLEFLKIIKKTHPLLIQAPPPQTHTHSLEQLI